MEEQEDGLINIDTSPDEPSLINIDTSPDEPMESNQYGQPTNSSQPKPFDSSLFNQPSQDSDTINFFGGDPPSTDCRTSGDELIEHLVPDRDGKQSSESTATIDSRESETQDQEVDENLTNVIIADPSEGEEVDLLSDKIDKLSTSESKEDIDREEELSETDEDELKLPSERDTSNSGEIAESTSESQHPLQGKDNKNANICIPVKDNKNANICIPVEKPSNTASLTSVRTFQKENTPWDDDDPFLSAISNSETDRRQDAWLPCDATAKVLQSRVSMQGTDYSSRPDLTMPGISFEETQMDPLKELLYKYHGEEEASKRKKLTLDQVTRDLDGLKKLLNDGCLHSAVQLTGLLLTSVGQGKGQSGMPSQNTAESIQIWFTRLALLVKLRQFNTADIESQPFKDLDKSDLYYQYYPALYPGRKGSMVPFSFRVLLAELPQFVSHNQDSMTRLYALLATCQKIVSNLSQGLDEYGDKSGVSEEYIKASLILWKSRINRVQYSIGNCLLAMKDYYQSIKVFQSLSKSDSLNSIRIHSLVGRIYLQLGDLKSAQATFAGIEKMSKAEDESAQIQILMNRGFLRMAQNMYTDAHIQFSEVIKLDPENFTAVNNISVCLLYMGKLKSALNLLESLVNGDPAKYLDESILFNLCTLYELESSQSANKKQGLLCMAAKHRGDGFNTSCLKL